MLSPFNPNFRKAQSAVRSLKSDELGGITRAFVGWKYLPPDPTWKQLPLEARQGKAPEAPKAEKTILKSFKELALFVAGDSSGVIERIPVKQASPWRGQEKYVLAKLPEWELRELWEQNHPTWKLPHLSEGLAPALVQIMDWLAGIGEVPNFESFGPKSRRFPEGEDDEGPETLEEVFAREDSMVRELDPVYS